MPERRVGLWLIGALGGVGSTVALGLAALRRGLTDLTGLVTGLPLCAGLDLDAIFDYAPFVRYADEIVGRLEAIVPVSEPALT